MIPTLVFLFSMAVFPLVYIITTSTEFWFLNRLDLGRHFVGFQNYLKLLKDKEFASSVWVTACFSMGIVSLQTLGGLSLAFFLARGHKGEGVIRALILLPWLISGIVIGFNFKFMMEPNFGPIPEIMRWFGLTELARISLYGRKEWALLAVVITYAWHGIPFTMMLCSAAIQSLPIEPFEAAKVDGATPFQTLWYISLPLLKSIVLINMFLVTMFTLRAFPLVFILTQGGPGTTTEILSLYQYRIFMRYYDVGYASVIAIIIFILIMGLGLFYLRMIFKKQ